MINLVLICWGIFVLYWIISSFFVKKSVSRRKDWKFQLIWRVIIIALIILIAIISKKTVLTIVLHPIFLSNLTLQIIGSVLVILGLVEAIWARISLGRNWSGYVTYKKNHELVTSGPYKYIRHPIYSSLILMLIGTFFNFPNTEVIIILLIWIVLFATRMKREEKIMTKLFGREYINYMDKSKRLIPWIY